MTEIPEAGMSGMLEYAAVSFEELHAERAEFLFSWGRLGLMAGVGRPGAAGRMADHGISAGPGAGVAELVVNLDARQRAIGGLAAGAEDGNEFHHKERRCR